MKKTRRRYDREFKISVVAELESGKPLAQIAREYGVHPSLLCRWRDELAENPERAFSDNGNRCKYEARIAELEKMSAMAMSASVWRKVIFQPIRLGIMQARTAGISNHRKGSLQCIARIICEGALELDEPLRPPLPYRKRPFVAGYDHIRHFYNLVHAGHGQGAIIVHCRRNPFLEVA